MVAWKRYSQTVLAGVLGLGLLAGCYALAAKQGWRYDLTATKQHSLDQASATILGNVNASVEAIAFFNPQDQQLKSQFQDLTDLVGRVTDKVHVEFVDPDRTPMRARELGVTRSGSVVVRSGDRKETLTFVDEERFVNAIARVTTEQQATVYYVQGHGEVNLESMEEGGASQLAEALRSQGATLEPLALAAVPDGEFIPEDANLVLILGPTTDYLPKELALLTQYVQRGGRVAIALAPERPVNVADWTTRHLGVQMEPGIAVDPAAQALLGDALTLLVQQYPSHPVTKEFNLFTLFPTAGAVTEVENATLPGPASGNATQSGIPLDITPLGLSTQVAWVERDMQGLQNGTADMTDGVDLAGPLWIGAAIQPSLPEEDTNATRPADSLRAVVFADPDFLTNRYANIYGNLDLARNTMNWLMEREGLITVNKPAAPNVFLTLTPTQGLLVKWLPLVFLPLAMFILAGAVAMLRRRAR